MKKLKLVLIIGLNLIFAQFAGAESLFWQQVSGPLSGDVMSFAQKSNGTIFAAARDNWIYRSNDLGKSWSKIQFDSTMKNLYVYSIAIRNGSEIFIGTTGGVFISEDDCASWSYIGKGLGDPFVNSLGVKSTGEVFASTMYDGLFRTTNKGVDWTDANKGMGSPSINTIAFTDNNDIFLGTYKGVFYSRDNGASWSAMNSGIPSGSYNIYSIAVIKKFNLLVGSSRGSIMKTTNNGGTWFPVLDLKDSSQVYSIVTKGDKEIYAAIYGKGVYNSMDGGATWQWINDGLFNNDVLSLFQPANSNDLLAGTWGSGVFRGTSDVIQVQFSSGEYCAGSEINIPFTISIGFDSTNYFTAQLSDSLGSFVNPVNIGKLNGKDGGVIVAKIPKNTPPGTGYRVRVVSYKPTVIGKNNGQDISIRELPPLNIEGKTLVCPNVPHVYKTESSGDIETKWAVIGGKITGDISSPSITVTFDSVGKGTVKLVQKHLLTGCQDSTILVVQVKFPDKPIITRKDTSLISNYDTGNQWFYEGTILPNETNKIIKPSKTGKYSVQVTDSTGCQTPVSDPYYINIESVIDISMNKYIFELSPIPATDLLKVRLLNENSVITAYTLYSLIGEKIAESREFSESKGIDVTNLSNGVYMISLVVDNQICFERFIIRR